MTFWLYLLLGALTSILLIAVGGWLLWRRITREERRLIKRIYALPLRRKIGLAGSLWRDDRIPLGIRLIPPALVLYLAMPLDLIPDFIPVIGQLDDVLVVLAGVSLLLRFVGRDVLEEHIRAFELRGAGEASASHPVHGADAKQEPDAPSTASRSLPRPIRLPRPHDSIRGDRR